MIVSYKIVLKSGKELIVHQNGGSCPIGNIAKACKDGLSTNSTIQFNEGQRGYLLVMMNEIAAIERLGD